LVRYHLSSIPFEDIRWMFPLCSIIIPSYPIVSEHGRTAAGETRRIAFHPKESELVLTEMPNFLIENLFGEYAKITSKSGVLRSYDLQ
jgi:hypothetical protein